MNQLQEAAMGIARQAADAAWETAQKAIVAAKDVSGEAEELARDAGEVTRDAAHRVTDKARKMYRTAALKTGDTLATSREYVRRNPVPVVLGAIAFGAAIGYIIMSARRKPSFSEQYEKEPLTAVREALFSALAPVSQRVHEGYESARSGVGKALDQTRRTKPGRAVDLWSDRIGRVGSNLKFW